MSDAWPPLPFGGGRDSLPDVLAQRLLAQRVVVLHGPLDDPALARLSAELMTLDAEGDEPVTLRIDCGEAGTAGALTLMDVIELMGVPVRALCLGQVGAGAIGIVAVCAHRAALPNTRFALREPSSATATLHARNVAQWAELQAAERERFCDRVGHAAKRSPERVREDVVRGLYLGAAEAVEYGLIDEVCRPEAAVHPLPGATSPMGFRPLR